MTILDPRRLVVDPQVKPFEFGEDVDLLAPNVPLLGTNKYVCWQYTVPAGQVLVVHGWTAFARQRINIGATDVTPPGESVAMIDPQQANGFFLFEPQVNGASPYIIGTDLAAPRVAGGVLNNNDRERGRGTTFLSTNPRDDAMRMWMNPLFSFLVPSEANLQIIFSILPAAKASPLPTTGQYTIGAAAIQQRRVDFAGAYVVGEQMSAQHYTDIVETLRKEARSKPTPAKKDK